MNRTSIHPAARSVGRSMVRLALAPAALAAFLAAGSPGPAGAQPKAPPQEDMTIDAAMRGEVIDGVVTGIREGYVFPDVAKKMESAIRRRQKGREYDRIASASALAESLTAHLQAVSHDKHVRVRYSLEPIPVENDSGPSPDEIEQWRLEASRSNFLFREVKRLDGNVGYLALDGFMPPMLSGETATAAMNFLANCDALIVDLRKNGGGSPEAIAYITTYLFDGPPVHLNDLYYRPKDETHQYWTLPHVPGKRLAGKDVYVLTSGRTFSGAEEFAYNLKNLKRATIVGETTRGGAHPGGPRRINDHFLVWVPSGRAINPISKTNWEGTGVEPDVKTTADEAFDTAYLAALRALRDAEPAAADPELAEEIDDAIAKLDGGEEGVD
jgi:hypothetical protein